MASAVQLPHGLLLVLLPLLPAMPACHMELAELSACSNGWALRTQGRKSGGHVPSFSGLLLCWSSVQHAGVQCSHTSM